MPSLTTSTSPNQRVRCQGHALSREHDVAPVPQLQREVEGGQLCIGGATTCANTASARHDPGSAWHASRPVNEAAECVHVCVWVWVCVCVCTCVFGATHSLSRGGKWRRAAPVRCRGAEPRNRVQTHRKAVHYVCRVSFSGNDISVLYRTPQYPFRPPGPQLGRPSLRCLLGRSLRE